MTGDSLMRISLRTVGRLLVAGVLTQPQAAALVRWAWCKASFELMPSGSTSTPAERGAIAAAANTEHWCETCVGVPHRVTFKSEKCPACRDDEKRGAA